LAPRAWWLLDMMRLQRVARGLDRDYLNERPAQMPEALEALDSALEGLEARGVPRELMVLGGFSQGAMLSMHFALSHAPKPRGLVLLSGTFIDAENWRAWMPSCRSVPVFQSHSPDDMVLPLALARQLHQELVSAGLSAEFVEFRGGHGISRPVLLALADFLARLVAAESGDFASDAP
jgi:phospholipase/carboxylesterase